MSHEVGEVAERRGVALLGRRRPATRPAEGGERCTRRQVAENGADRGDERREDHAQEGEVQRGGVRLCEGEHERGERRAQPHGVEEEHSHPRHAVRQVATRDTEA